MSIDGNLPGNILNAAFNQAFQINNGQELRVVPSGVLFHYTNAEGLIGIVEKKKLWATSAYFLNDSAEIHYGYSVLKKTLEAVMKFEPI